MKRVIQILVVVTIILGIGNLLTWGETSLNVPADIQRVAGSLPSPMLPNQGYFQKSSASQVQDPNTPQEPETAESRFKRARTRYRNVAQQLLDSLAEWEQRVQSTIRKIEKLEKDWEKSRPDLIDETSQRITPTNSENVASSQTSSVDQSSHVFDREVDVDEARGTAAPGNVTLQRHDRSEQTEELARQCEQLAKQLLKVAAQLRTNRRILE